MEMQNAKCKMQNCGAAAPGRHFWIDFARTGGSQGVDVVSEEHAKMLKI